MKLSEKFNLIELHRHMSKTERRIVFSVDSYERECGRPLPDWGFYKLLACRICQRVGG